MRKAVEHGAAAKKDLSLLEDRVAIEQGREQIYGTQIGLNDKTNKYYLLPLKNPNGVNKRRAQMGLSPISTYLSQWQIEWDGI